METFKFMLQLKKKEQRKLIRRQYPLKSFSRNTNMKIGILAILFPKL